MLQPFNVGLRSIRRLEADPTVATLLRYTDALGEDLFIVLTDTDEAPSE